MEDRYYTRLAAAYVRGTLDGLQEETDASVLRIGLDQGLRLHKFKMTGLLPRVQKVFGFLHALHPGTLLDIGSGRGAFLWPLLGAFPELSVTVVETDTSRVEDIQAVQRGGIENLRALVMDVSGATFPDSSFDVVTILEVLEHLEYPERAASSVCRLTGGFVIASVPSKEDDNPGHIRLFTKQSLERLFLDAGAKSVRIEYILNHMIAMAKCK